MHCVPNHVIAPRSGLQKILAKRDVPRFVPQGDSLAAAEHCHLFANPVTGLSGAGRLNIGATDNAFTAKNLGPGRTAALLAFSTELTCVATGLLVGTV